MPPTTTRLIHWEDLAGKTLTAGYPEGTGFVLESADGHATLCSRDASLEVMAERALDGEGLTETVEEWTWLAGLKIVAIHAPILAAGHSAKTTARFTFDNGQTLVLRSAISYEPIILA